MLSLSVFETNTEVGMTFRQLHLWACCSKEGQWIVDGI